MSRPRITSTAWAVYLGCTTAKRLANELGITESSARGRLRRAHLNGLVSKVSKGLYFCLSVDACATGAA